MTSIITGMTLPTVDKLSESHVTNNTEHIIQDQSHPLHELYSVLRSRSNRYRKSTFLSTSIGLPNARSATTDWNVGNEYELCSICDYPNFVGLCWCELLPYEWSIWDWLLNSIVLHCTALHCIALHCIALHCIALHCIALHCIALHCIALHCIALHCIALHCIALYCFDLI